jgi:hypothetical protein
VSSEDLVYKHADNDNAPLEPEAPRQRLPAEVIGIVAKFLLADDAYGTCAALNVCSRAIYNEVLPDLWKKMVL